ncbi:DUF4227 family protein [Paenibacillus larvae]|uniref:DUF4227 family protein n=1 Tax=Paenibacillus larvae TaxID=1464 RepID=UPI0023A9282B|nr:DUF4227 family protein [Paenibacillus larvae]MDE5132687.1 DUF4227 family protein [Paenibacillus larvae subsp. larvae]
MIFSLRKWMARLKFLFLFLVLTFIMYQALRICSVWIEPIHKYKEPDGESVKAFSKFKDQTKPVRMLDRLRFFYWYGE